MARRFHFFFYQNFISDWANAKMLFSVSVVMIWQYVKLIIEGVRVLRHFFLQITYSKITLNRNFLNKHDSI